MSYACDYAPSEFYCESIHVARKPHKCCECDVLIGVGERYANCRGKWDGRIWVFRQHMRCFHFARYVNHDALGESDDGYLDGCIPFGGLNECMRYERPELREIWRKVMLDRFEFKPSPESSMAEQFAMIHQGKEL